jgi:hypothetical protein
MRLVGKLRVLGRSRRALQVAVDHGDVSVVLTVHATD